MREAKLCEGSSEKVVMWTGGSYEYDDVIRALLRLDRPEIQPGTTPHTATPVYDTEPRAGAHPGANWSVSSTGEEPFQVEEAFWAIQEHKMLRGRRDHDRVGTEPIPVFFLGFESIRHRFEEGDVPQNLLQAQQANRQPNYWTLETI